MQSRSSELCSHYDRSIQRPRVDSSNTLLVLSTAGCTLSASMAVLQLYMAPDFIRIEACV